MGGIGQLGRAQTLAESTTPGRQHGGMPKLPTSNPALEAAYRLALVGKRDGA